MKANMLMAVAGACVVGLAFWGCGGSDYGTGDAEAQQEFRKYCDRLEDKLFTTNRRPDDKVSSPFVEIVAGRQVASFLVIEGRKQYDVTVEGSDGGWSLLEVRQTDADGNMVPVDEATTARFRTAIEAANAE